jgi:hypothetical protein
MKVEEFTLITDMSDEDYHHQHDEDSHYLSSSQAKTALEDIELYHASYITKEIPRKVIAAFDVGTVYHGKILEPEKIEGTYAVYDGRRAGAKWEAFKKENEGKILLTATDYAKVQTLVEGTQNSEIAQYIYADGDAECSLFVSYYADLKNEILYLLDKDSSYKLTIEGWVACERPETKDLKRIRLKVRADYLNFDKGYIADLKSTSGNVKKSEGIQYKIKDYSYDLSAAMYLDAFNSMTLLRGGEAKFTDFYWTFASKDYPCAKNYSCSEDSFRVGRAKYIKALFSIAKASANKWVFEDTIVDLGPNVYEKAEWLTPKEKNKPTTKKFETKPIITANENGEDLL